MCRFHIGALLFKPPSKLLDFLSPSMPCVHCGYTCAPHPGVLKQTAALQTHLSSALGFILLISHVLYNLLLFTPLTPQGGVRQASLCSLSSFVSHIIPAPHHHGLLSFTIFHPPPHPPSFSTSTIHHSPSHLTTPRPPHTQGPCAPMLSIISLSLPLITYIPL